MSITVKMKKIIKLMMVVTIELIGPKTITIKEQEMKERWGKWETFAAERHSQPMLDQTDSIPLPKP